MSNTAVANYNIKLKVTTTAGCIDSISKPNFITVFPLPVANFTMDPNPGNIITPLETFTNESENYTTWYWNFGDGPKIDSVNLNPSHLYTDETASTFTIELIVKNTFGCRDTVYNAIEIKPEFTFYIPNSFSPSDGNGINDIFTGKGIGIDKFEMLIFDRWGEQIFTTKDINLGWDGTLKGEVVKQDIYTWKVKIVDVNGKRHNYVGHVTVL